MSSRSNDLMLIIVVTTKVVLIVTIKMGYNQLIWKV